MLATFILALNLAWSTPHATGHQLHAAVHPRASFSRAPVPSAGRPDMTVYGYLPYWASDPLAVDFDSLTHVAWFDVGLAANGAVTGADSWMGIRESLVSAAHASGTKVHLCVALFDEDTQRSILTSAEHRARAVSELAALINDAGADGVNIDFEGMGVESKQGLVSFTEELSAVVDEVFLAMPAVDWLGAYDFDALSAASDGLFIMAYDYHWSGGDPGPISPLTGGGPWSLYAMDWSLNDYRTYGASDDKLIMGLPLYGKEWPTSNDAVPGVSLGSGEAYTMAAVLNDLGTMDVRYDAVSDTPWAWTGASQLWFDDHDSLEIKMSWAASEGIQGIGFWALGYADGDPEFWARVDAVSGANVPDSEDTGSPSGGDDTAASDTAAPDTGEINDEGVAPKGGCSCSATPAGMQWWWAMMALLAIGRRQN